MSNFSITSSSFPTTKKTYDLQDMLATHSIESWTNGNSNGYNSVATNYYHPAFYSEKVNAKANTIKVDYLVDGTNDKGGICNRTALRLPSSKYSEFNNLDLFNGKLKIGSSASSMKASPAAVKGNFPCYDFLEDFKASDSTHELWIEPIDTNPYCVRLYAKKGDTTTTISKCIKSVILAFCGGGGGGGNIGKDGGFWRNGGAGGGAATIFLWLYFLKQPTAATKIGRFCMGAGGDIGADGTASWVEININGTMLHFDALGGSAGKTAGTGRASGGSPRSWVGSGSDYNGRTGDIKDGDKFTDNNGVFFCKQIYSHSGSYGGAKLEWGGEIGKKTTVGDAATLKIDLPTAIDTVKDYGKAPTPGYDWGGTEAGAGGGSSMLGRGGYYNGNSSSITLPSYGGGGVNKVSTSWFGESKQGCGGTSGILYFYH